METFFSSLILQALAAAWLATGFVKSLVVVQQLPSLMSWHVFYQTDDIDAAADWRSNKILMVLMVVLGLVAVVGYTLLGPFLALMGKERGMRYFTPYGDPYIAGMAASHLNIPTGVTPFRFESWEQYQHRIGDNPQAVANAIVAAQPKLPESIAKVLDDAHELQNMKREEIEVSEEEEFRD